MSKRKLQLLTDRPPSGTRKTLLVAMPWAHPEVPSIQIGVLEKYLSSRGVPVEAGHWYLNLALEFGFDAYDRISRHAVNAAEPLYSYLLFPEMRSFLLNDEGLKNRARGICKALAASPEKTDLLFRWDEGFFRDFEKSHQAILDRYRWEDYSLVGFTLNYGQTVASLYMAREIKKRNPRCRIILGGAEASGELGASLVENFSQVDYACNGEGELPLYQLSKALLDGASEDEIRRIGGLIYREEEGGVRINPPQQIASLDDLETPGYDDYLSVFLEKGLDPYAFLRELPIEASRGCPFSCNFCGLNLQWENFRSRSPEKVSDDIRMLARKYSVLEFRFMDNILPKNSEKIFEKISEHGMDYRFFYEIRAQTPVRVLRLMKRAGASLIQYGLEALSTSLLKKFNKKAKFINNLQALKISEELGIETENNLIIDFPESTREEVEETVRNMEFCLSYQPAQLSPYSLGVGSPDYAKRNERGYREVRNADFYRYVYPPELFDKLHLIAKDFRAPHRRVSWRPVVAALNRWKKVYSKGKKSLKNGRKHLLCYFDGGTFLRIEDYRGSSDGTSVLYRLDQIQRDIYLFAEEIRSWNAIKERFPFEDSELKSLLQYFIDRKLMYEEDGHYLSLAINVQPMKTTGAHLDDRDGIPMPSVIHL